MEKVGRVLSHFSIRFLGLVALSALVSLFIGSGVQGENWRDQLGIDLSDLSLLLIMSVPLMCTAVLFLIPPLSNWLFAPAEGLGGAAKWCARYFCIFWSFAPGALLISHEDLLPDARGIILFLAAICLIFLMLQRPIAHDPALDDYLDDLTAIPDSAESLAAYRIIDTDADDEALSSIEERRERLIRSADFNNLPQHVREAFTRMSQLRVILCSLFIAPILICVVVGLFGALAANFLPTREVQEVASHQTGPFVLYSVVAGVFFAAFGPRFSTRRKRPRSRIAVGFIFCALFALLARLTFYSAIAMGAPGFHALYVGGPVATAAVVVVARANDKAAFCGRWADIRVGPKAPLHRLCRLDSTLADDIVSGERLFLTGVATKYGIRYHNINR